MLQKKKKKKVCVKEKNLGTHSLSEQTMRDEELENEKPSQFPTLLQPVLAGIVLILCQLILLPQTSWHSFYSQCAIFWNRKPPNPRKRRDYWFKNSVPPIDFSHLCCCWHLWWLKEEQRSEIQFHCPSCFSLCPPGFFLGLGCEVDIISFHWYW